ncbi:efflux RND transporter permease subunit, partial [Klebsiella pneumoniae]
PILMTTLTAILGLAPLALGLGAGAEMQKPLAVAVVGGLAFSTLLTLVFGPILWAQMMGLRRKR